MTPNKYVHVMRVCTKKVKSAKSKRFFDHVEFLISHKFNDLLLQLKSVLVLFSSFNLFPILLNPIKSFKPFVKSLDKTHYLCSSLHWQKD